MTRAPQPVLMVVALAVLISACGGSGGSDGIGGPPPPANDTVVASVTVSPPTLNLEVGADTQLTATPYNANGQALSGRTVTWASSDNNIATVSSSGLVHAVAAGSVSITATLDGKSGSAAATITSTPPPPPPPSTTISPGENIQAVVDFHPPGTTFTLRAGVHQGQSVIPRSGDTFIGEPGAILDGGRTVRVAFDKGGADVLPSNVTIRGLVIRNYVPGPQVGAINAGNPGGAPELQSVGWVIQDCEVYDNVGAGITFGHKAQVLDNYVHHNDQIGIRGSGDSVLVQGNEIAHNNPNWNYQYEGTGREFGGTKFASTRALIVRGNYIHNNNGNGLWTDVDNFDALHENNRVVDNAGVGIFHEISFAVVIRNNVSTGNGAVRGGMYGGGILISNSSNAEVYGNTVTGNKMGITANDLSREPGPHGPYELRNLDVHDNTVQTNGQTGIATLSGSDAVYTPSFNNRFRHNTYTGLGSNPTPFFWRNEERTVEEWKSFGQDVDGTFVQ